MKKSTAQNKKIVCVHLLNDYSGSPLVLSTAIKGMLAQGYAVDVITGTKGEGFLSNLPTGKRHFFYSFSPNIFIRLLLYSLSQLHLFVMMLRYWREPVIVYVNTLLPAGAALAAKMMRKKVIYHLHETSINPPLFKKALRTVTAMCADTVIYVSAFLEQEERIPNVQNHVVHNALTNDFMDRAMLFNPTQKLNHRFTVLMICSLKEYKGVYDFLELSESFPNLDFEIVLNASQKDIDDALHTRNKGSNIKIYPVQSNVHRFYERAHLVLNLSHPDKWIETFGMTLLEAMSYGIPVLAPPVGGATEFVEHQSNGFLCSVHQKDQLKESLEQISSDKNLYQKFSENARIKAKTFDEWEMQNKIIDILKK
ncbi:MAG TPA: glycosyltransferase family 4 protein [Bacteroidia bacterium]|nr:glycosyltransferase family 4 protein [Bacteroidia bacterium]